MRQFHPKRRGPAHRHARQALPRRLEPPPLRRAELKVRNQLVNLRLRRLLQEAELLVAFELELRRQRLKLGANGAEPDREVRRRRLEQRRRAIARAGLGFGTGVGRRRAGRLLGDRDQIRLAELVRVARGVLDGVPDIRRVLVVHVDHYAALALREEVGVPRVGDDGHRVVELDAAPARGAIGPAGGKFPPLLRLLPFRRRRRRRRRALLGVVLPAALQHRLPVRAELLVAVVAHALVRQVRLPPLPRQREAVRAAGVAEHLAAEAAVVLPEEDAEALHAVGAGVARPVPRPQRAVDRQRHARACAARILLLQLLRDPQPAPDRPSHDQLRLLRDAQPALDRRREEGPLAPRAPA